MSMRIYLSYRPLEYSNTQMFIVHVLTFLPIPTVCFYREYFESLEVVCERGSKDNYGLLNWTVAEETDDIVYYQSYTHEVGQKQIT